MPIGPARMPLFDHLGELRRRLTIVVVCVVIASELYLCREGSEGQWLSRCTPR